MARRNIPSLVIDDEGSVIMNAGKYARQSVLLAFEAIGGVERMARWADENPGEFYTRVFTKTITREVETRRTDDVDSLLDSIDGEYSVVDDDG